MATLDNHSIYHRYLTSRTLFFCVVYKFKLSTKTITKIFVIIYLVVDIHLLTLWIQDGFEYFHCRCDTDGQSREIICSQKRFRQLFYAFSLQMQYWLTSLNRIAACRCRISLNCSSDFVKLFFSLENFASCLVLCTLIGLMVQVVSECNMRG